MRYLIATAARPKTLHQGYIMFDKIRDEAAVAGLVAGPFYWTEGPRCSNLAFDLEGDESMCDTFVRQLTFALMPAKWGVTSDKIPSSDYIDLRGLN